MTQERFVLPMALAYEKLQQQQGDKRTYEPDPKPVPKKKGKRK